MLLFFNSIFTIFRIHPFLFVKWNDSEYIEIKKKKNILKLIYNTVPQGSWKIAVKMQARISAQISWFYYSFPNPNCFIILEFYIIVNYYK